uniref:Sodium-dependent nutrient amino acid transporter 1 n=1 Tax=Megaselia scalaris TaxID=36166 RepID=T1GV02_MEGSC
MSCISMSVGLGNVWRKPMYYLEMILGQFSSKSSIEVWCICPLLRGVGIGQMFGTISIITYYSSLLALTLYYFGVSFQSVLPWAYCKPEYGPNCLSSALSDLEIGQSNQSSELKSSSEYFFLFCTDCILNRLDSGVIYFRGGGYFGVSFQSVLPWAYCKPEYGPNCLIWKEAVVQCFFSLSVGQGPIIMFSSYNKFDHRIYRDAMIVTSLDTVTSLLAGITMFAILGNLAHNLNAPISKVVKSGTALAFISYPDAIAKFPAVPQVFSVLFFFMLFVLGVGTEVALVSGLVSALADRFTTVKYWVFALSVCISGFLCGLVYITPGGHF